MLLNLKFQTMNQHTSGFVVIILFMSTQLHHFNFLCLLTKFTTIDTVIKASKIPDNTHHTHLYCCLKALKGPHHEIFSPLFFILMIIPSTLINS
jgi:hypothetical protein